MRTAKEIKDTIKKCEAAQAKGKDCPIWPDDDILICVDCTCRLALKWVLQIKDFDR